MNRVKENEWKRKGEENAYKESSVFENRLMD